MIKIGYSACFFHSDPNRALFKGKTLLYMEESLAHLLERSGALPVLIPTLTPKGPLTLPGVVAGLDGLVLQGGDDVSPKNYGEEPLQPKWSGDYARDQYEKALITEFLRQKKPILGICRGAQMLNVALGGTLYQDIGTQVPGALVHRDWTIYDANAHDVDIKEGGLLAKLFGARRVRTNSVHHQAIKDLAPGLVVEAVSATDGVIEAVRLAKGPFVVALQWHPEFHGGYPEFLDTTPLVEAFLKAARPKRKTPKKPSRKKRR